MCAVGLATRAAISAAGAPSAFSSYGLLSAWQRLFALGHAQQSASLTDNMNRFCCATSPEAVRPREINSHCQAPGRAFDPVEIVGGAVLVAAGPG